VLALTVPLNKTLGPVTLEAIHVALAREAERASLLLGLTGGVALPALAARFENAGLALYAEAAEDGVAGGLALTAGFKPPDAVGFVADIGGVVTGGGYVGHDPALGRYTGALQLEALEVGLAAIVVVDTKLPGDPDGWALFCSLSLTFPGVPLGFGFFLSGVGGLVALNRTLDVEGFASGLQSGAVDAVLFPDDVLNDSALLVSQLDAWFPLAEGSAVFGVAAQITWGAPKPIVTGELGVALSFPELDIVVLGSVEMVLPDGDDAQLELHMDALGAIDVSEQTILVVASLYDSTLLNTFSLSGDMAMYGRFGTDPYFLLSVGGYHPTWDPPCGLPAAVLDLDRMRLEVTISEDVWYALEAYVAVTSNTLQFGARATLVASAQFLGVTYTARGSVGFNVLLELAPFAFRANFRASVSVTAGSSDKELLAVSLGARLNGPKPWFATGHATFDFFGLEVPFAIEFGGAADAEAPERINLLEAVLAALEDPSAWRGTAPTGADAGAVLLAVEAGEAGAPVRPDGELEAVQNVAPLERTLDRYNELEIDGPDNLDVTAARLGDDEVAYEAVLDWFSPAQYDDMDTCEKLAAPSYELMTAGVRFGADSVTVSDVPEHRRTVTPTYEVRIIDREETHDLGVLPLATTLRSATAGLVLDGARRVRSGRTVDSTTFTVAPTRWTTADAVTGEALGTATTYRDALAARRQAAPGAVRVAPNHAVAT
jgi:hypothetical protein